MIFHVILPVIFAVIAVGFCAMSLYERTLRLALWQFMAATWAINSLLGYLTK